jgi:hypothetical protein
MGGSIMAVVINGTTGIDKVQDGSIGTADLAADAVTTAKIADTVNLGRRNMLINGAMQVAQRGTGAIQASSDTYPTIDRFKFFLSGGGAYTVEQDSGHQADTGHDKAIKIAVTTADTSIAAGDYYSFLQRIESNSVQHLQYGTPSAKSVTLSFWVRATKTGTHAVHFAKQGSGTDYRHIKEYTINTTNTWEHKTITIPGLTAATITNDASTYFQVGWMLKYGSDYQGTKDSWITDGHYTTANAVNNMDSTSNTFYVTGVQLEVGDTATPFEHRSYGEELTLCQRYCFQLDGQDYSVIGMKDQSLECFFPFPTTMRTQPTVHWSGTLSDYTIRSGGTDYTPTSFSQLGIRDYHYGWVRITNSSVGATGYVGGNADGFVRFDSEL